MANQKSVRYSVSISYFTNIAVQNVNKVRTCAHEWTSSLNGIFSFDNQFNNGSVYILICFFYGVLDIFLNFKIMY